VIEIQKTKTAHQGFKNQKEGKTTCIPTHDFILSSSRAEYSNTFLAVHRYSILFIMVLLGNVYSSEQTAYYDYYYYYNDDD
jgi:hypothetical protein